MTNREKYKTEEARSEAFYKFCDKHGYCGNGCILWSNVKCGEVNCRILWLDLETEDEEPMPCPFCGGSTFLKDSDVQDSASVVYCGKCEYQSNASKTEAEAIAAHNRVYKAVKAFNESEVKNV